MHSEIDVAFHDGVVDELVNAGVIAISQRGLEEDFGDAEDLVAKSDIVQIRECIGFGQCR